MAKGKNVGANKSQQSQVRDLEENRQARYDALHNHNLHAISSLGKLIDDIQKN